MAFIKSIRGKGNASSLVHKFKLGSLILFTATIPVNNNLNSFMVLFVPV